MKLRGLILLDRDGVLNEMVVDPDHGTIDSPLHPAQVRVFPWVAEALSMMSRAGYGLCVVTNQPAAAQGKTTRANLEAVHDRIVALACGAEPGALFSSHICYHRSEDQCACRKPLPGLLEQAFSAHPQYPRTGSWMVGDGITDIQAGQALGIQSAFIGPPKAYMHRALLERDLHPDAWHPDLCTFAQHISRIDSSE